MAEKIDRIFLLRVELAKQKLHGFILPVNDEFMGEYIPASAKRLEWLTGFSGSAGMVAVLPEKAAFFTDGRYTLQAQKEVQGYEIYNSAALTPEKWLSEQFLNDAGLIGYDPKLHTLQQVNKYEKATNLHFQPVSFNPIDAIWNDRPAPPDSNVKIQPLEYAGETSLSKRQRVAAGLGADAVILTAPDSICWLLNIRAGDVPYTPFLLSYAILGRNAEITLYADESRFSAEVREHLGKGVILQPAHQLEADLKKLSGKRILYDPATSPIWFYHILIHNNVEVIEGADPCQLPKAIKNSTELEGIRQAHIRDGKAVTAFLGWLKEAVERKKPLTEISIAEKLEEFRKVSPLYLEPSFATIAGSGANGAIVHYHASPETNKPLEYNNLLLVDSGGQYQDGTTDITRTLAIGEPTPEMKRHFTLVLKGHIALVTALFPEGTSGSQLDALARQFLWQEGLDYDHGTGHGVGSYLSVHEGPQRVSKRGGDAPLQPGMILSNEPGYYRAGEYGIRIENLVVVKEVMQSQGKRYFGFETLTLAPLDMRLVEKSLMTVKELEWLEQYHLQVHEIFSK